jgi:BASS family bile acid:Na+ symporter
MDAVLELGQKLLNPLVLGFTISSLASMGLQVVIPRMIQKLRNPRLLILTLIWGWITGPAIAYLITRILPLAEPYAVVLLIGSLAPSAPFLPPVVEKARGDIDFAGAFIPVAAVGTVLFMPLMAPLLIPGLTLSPMAIVIPLVITVLIPLLLGAVIRTYAPRIGNTLYRPVKAIAGLSTALLILNCLLLFGQRILDTAGSFAFISMTLFMVIVGFMAYRFGFGLSQSERSVMSLGIGTRNFAAIFTAVLAIPNADPRMPAMVVMWTVWALILAQVSAYIFGRLAVTASGGASAQEQPIVDGKKGLIGLPSEVSISGNEARQGHGTDQSLPREARPREGHP